MEASENGDEKSVIYQTVVSISVFGRLIVEKTYSDAFC